MAEVVPLWEGLVPGEGYYRVIPHPKGYEGAYLVEWRTDRDEWVEADAAEEVAAHLARELAAQREAVAGLVRVATHLTIGGYDGVGCRVVGQGDIEALVAALANPALAAFREVGRG
jgi:hypothetical protein